jgi:myo-inositol-1(or 4)-monophosphatase
MDDFALAISVANEGAAVVRDRFGTHLTRLDKGSGDFATNADIEAEKAMLALLRRERPDDGILGEESGSSGTTNLTSPVGNRRHAPQSSPIHSTMSQGAALLLVILTTVQASGFSWS